MDDESEIVQYDDIKVINGSLLWNVQVKKLKQEYYHSTSVKQ